MAPQILTTYEILLAILLTSFLLDICAAVPLPPTSTHMKEVSHVIPRSLSGGAIAAIICFS